jgi:hypothetical protein
VALSVVPGAAAQTPDELIVLYDLGHNAIGVPTESSRRLQDWLAGEGFTVESFRGSLTTDLLNRGNILVLRVPLADEQANTWRASPRPTSPAFNSSEISAVERWVRDGGGLLLVADHMPMAGAVQSLARSFGVEILDGFVLPEDRLNPMGTLGDFDSGGWMTHSRSLGNLVGHPITDGRSPAERVEYLTTDVGSALKLPPEFVSLITLRRGSVSLMPDTAWSLHHRNAREDVEGWSQAAAACLGQGRVVLLADGWPFLPGPHFDNEAQEEAARYHPQFTLNVTIRSSPSTSCVGWQASFHARSD